MVTHPKVLGLTLDPNLTYSTHIHNISVQAHNPLHMNDCTARQMDGEAGWWSTSGKIGPPPISKCHGSG